MQKQLLILVALVLAAVAGYVYVYDTPTDKQQEAIDFRAMCAANPEKQECKDALSPAGAGN